MKNQNLFNIAAVLGLVVALIAGGAVLLAPKPAAPVISSQTTSSPCYFSPGGVAFNAGSGCTIDVASGGTLTLESGSSFTNGAAQTGTDINLSGGLTASTSTITNAATAGSLAVGGGYGSTGSTFSATGGGDFNGAVNVDGAVVVTGTSTFGNVMTVNANGDFDSISVAGNSDVTTINNTGANPVTVNDDLAVTGTLSVTGATFTGPIKYGTAASYTSGDSITHGFATTPTMCILQPTRDVTSTLTITATGFSSNMATVAEPIYWMCGQ